MDLFLGIIVMTIAIGGMALSSMFNKKPLSGSCGGLNPDGACSVCGDDPMKCEKSD